MRREVSKTPIIRTIEPIQAFIDRLVGGQIATDGVQYSAIATVGTGGTVVFTKRIDPGVDLTLKSLEVGLTQRFNNLLATSVVSLSYWWRARVDNVGTSNQNWQTLSALAKGIPTSGVAGDPVEDTLSGFFPVGSLPEAPFILDLIAQGLVASGLTGEVKNSSYVKLVGIVIPGT